MYRFGSDGFDFIISEQSENIEWKREFVHVCVRACFPWSIECIQVQLISLTTWKFT